MTTVVSEEGAQKGSTRRGELNDLYHSEEYIRRIELES